MTVYIILHVFVMVICLIGLFRSWRVLKQYPAAIAFAKWPLSLLVVLLFCSAVTILDLAVIDFISNTFINILAAVELSYSAVVAAMSIPYIARVYRVK